MHADPSVARSLRWYLALLGLAIGAITALNLAGIRLSADGGSGTGLGGVHAGPAAGAAVGIILLAGLAGIGVGTVFLVSHGADLHRFPRPRIQPQVLVLSFVAYLLSYVFLSAFGAMVMVLAGIDASGLGGALAYVAMQGLTMLGALALGMSALRVLTAYTGEDPREIGLKPSRLGSPIKWGIGGYMAALPLMGAGLVVWSVLSRLFFKEVATPEHPIARMVLEGGAVFWIVMVLAAVVAPIVEETCFRGMLYNALRGVMGVWPAAIVSGAMFAIIHPTLPAGFLPILALGCVLALLREATGSLLPSMVCHAINNAVALALVRFVYG